MGSQQHAVGVGKLLKKDKLVLLVDLDNTVIVSRRTERPQRPRTDKDEKAVGHNKGKRIRLPPLHCYVSVRVPGSF